MNSRTQTSCICRERRGVLTVSEGRKDLGDEFTIVNESGCTAQLFVVLAISHEVLDVVAQFVQLLVAHRIGAVGLPFKFVRLSFPLGNELDCSKLRYVQHTAKMEAGFGFQILQRANILLYRRARFFHD